MIAGKAQQRQSWFLNGLAVVCMGVQIPLDWFAPPVWWGFFVSAQPMTTQSRALRLADALSRAPFAWPGGYPLFAITSDGGCLCRHCCAAERLAIATTTGQDGWTVTDLTVNWEDPELTCDHCGGRIEPAYAEG